MAPDRCFISWLFVLGATTDEDLYFCPPAPGEWEIEAITMSPNTTVATDGTDYRTTTISVGGTTVASQTTNSTGGSARTAGTPQNLTLSNVGTTRLTGGTDAIRINSTKTGGSGEVEDCGYCISLRQVRA